ncbi:hypothetical protein A2U01_0093589, partial [Trifolium medium]|nr:hypothetical protein [Trifolium medium]
MEASSNANSASLGTKIKSVQQQPYCQAKARQSLQRVWQLYGN